MSTARRCVEPRAGRILDEVNAQITGRLVPVLKAIDLLADSQRVLNALSAAAMVDESLDLRLRSVVDAWCNPMSDSTRDGYAVLAELAGVASSMAGELCANAIAEIDRRDRAEADAST